MSALASDRSMPGEVADDPSTSGGGADRPSTASAEAARGDRVVDGVYRALPDEVSDRLLALVTALAAEVWTTRDRLRLVEAALAQAGVTVPVDAVRDTPAQIEAMRADRDAFVERVFTVVARPEHASAPDA